MISLGCDLFVELKLKHSVVSQRGRSGILCIRCLPFYPDSVVVLSEQQVFHFTTTMVCFGGILES